MPKLHFFNPGSEEAVWSGNIHLTPTANVQRMFTDLSCLPLWYADQEDFVWTENPNAASYSEEMHMIFPKLPQIFTAETMKKPEEYPLWKLLLGGYLLIVCINSNFSGKKQIYLSPFLHGKSVIAR